MGNLFSNKEAEENRRKAAQEAELARRRLLNQLFDVENLQRLERQRQVERQQQVERQRQVERQVEQQRVLQMQNVFNRSYSSWLGGSPYSESASIPPRNSVPDPVIVNYIINQCVADGWSAMNNHEIVKFVKLDSNSQEYRNVVRIFQNTNKRTFKVSEIERIQNPYLYGAYLMKKEEAKCRFGDTQERLLFHGTKMCNVDSICNNNFDWRRHGKGTGHRYGQGVSFTPISNYATHYCDRRSRIKVMLVAKVLISETCVGNSEMVIPPTYCDTSQKENGQVIVKYDDNEFYPAYKLHFYTTPQTTINRMSP